MSSLAARSKEILEEALRLPVGERASFVDAQTAAGAAGGNELKAFLSLYQRASTANPGWTAETTFGDAGSPREPPATRAAERSAVFALNRKFGPYRVIGLLKPGGMGEVALAEDARLPRQVVLKCLAGRWLASPLSRQRLMREARAAAALNHPNIATLYDVLEDTELPMLVMEFVEGRTLRDILGAGPLPLGLALRYAIQITDAVSYAHDRGIVHCDIKPSNVQITPAHIAKVLDFGLARAHFEAGDELSASEAGKLLGTPGYMPPERLIEGTLNIAGDVYALGVVLFELLTSRPPYAEIGPQLMLAVLTSDAPRPSAIVPGLPPQLDTIVGRALARNADLRYRSARELARDLVDALSAIEGRTWSGQLQLIEPPKPPIDLRWIVVVAGGVLIAVTFAGFATTTIYSAPLGINEGFQRESAWTWPIWGLQTFTAPVVFVVLIGIAFLMATFFGRLMWANIASLRSAAEPLARAIRRWVAGVNAAPTSLLAPLLLTAQVTVLILYMWRFRDVIEGLDVLITERLGGSLAALRAGNRAEHNALGQWLSVQLFVFGAAWYQLIKRRWTRNDRDAKPIVAGGILVLALSFLFFQVIPFRLLYHNEAERVLYQSQVCHLVAQRADEALLFCPAQPPPWKRVVKIGDPDLERQGTFQSIFASLDEKD